ALLPGNTRAAGPSYDDYVAQVKAGKIEIDYTGFRLACAASSKYAPYSVVEIVSKLKKAYDAGERYRRSSRSVRLSNATACLHRALRLPDPPHMGEAESALIFQAVAERAIEADMGQPDHGDREDERRGGAKAG